MDSIRYIRRTTGQIETERVFGGEAIRFLYGKGILSTLVGRPILWFISRPPLFSYLYGLWQKAPWTAAKIPEFIRDYRVDASEFAQPISTFCSFNDFFIRKLSSSARPIAAGDEIAVLPADARYRVYQDLSKVDGFLVKGKIFSLSALLEDPKLASEYAKGSMVMARLAPPDYHRFHFPVTAIPRAVKRINGYLYSVNPIALRRWISIFTENKRVVTVLESEQFGKILFIEVGATNVGSIHQTFRPNVMHPKGAEKGFFSFGGSALILLFQPGKIVFDQDLVEATKSGLEVLGLMGQTLGRSQ